MNDTDDRSAREIEREVEIERSQLKGTLDKLTDRMRPGAFVEEAIAYMREGGSAGFAGSLGREMRTNPLPVLLISIGLVWLAASAGRAGPAPRRRGADPYRDPRVGPMIGDGGDAHADAVPVGALSRVRTTRRNGGRRP